MFERDQPKSMRAPVSDSNFDELIRSSVATYGEPAPDSELAQRILVQIAAEPRPATWHRWWPLAVAVPIAACLIAFFTLFELRPVHAPTELTEHARATGQIDIERSTANVASATPYQSRRGGQTRLSRRELRSHLIIDAEAQPLPKLDVFPTPQPLTPAEQALLQFATQTPVAERKSLIEAQPQPDTPLTIAAIKIQPIELPELGN